MNHKNTDENGNCLICGYNENTPSLPSYLAPGTLINDRYLVGKLRSYNGESADYIGFDAITQTRVIVKEYMPDTLCSREKGNKAVSVDPKYVAQYKTYMSEFVELNKTLSKMRTLSHIIPVTDMFGDNNTGYAVFSYYNGVTLGEYLKNNAGELSWEEVRKLFPPVFTTLSLVHNAGIVHRGISPETILIGEDGSDIKLTGFAVSDERTANTDLAPELFSGYAAPEQYNSANWQGTWTDVYGLCALLYRVLTGVTPAAAPDRIANDNLIEPAKLNPNIPKNVSKVIMKGLELNGEMRIQTITELVTQIFEQPEYNSVRLSSSSTQTISIPKQSSSGKSSSHKNNKKGRVSRRSLFVVVIAVILGIGMFFLLIMLFALGGDTSQSDSDISGIASITTEAPFTDQSDELTSLTEMTEPEYTETRTESTHSKTIYVMNDITGKNYELIVRSDTYSSLVFNPVYEYNDSVEKGNIFEQSIKKDENYEEGTEITVKVSMGPRYISIPDFEGRSKKDYFALLNKAGIKYEESTVETADVKEGYVVRLSKDAGSQIDVEAGEVLTVYVAVAPPVTETTTVETEPSETEAPDEVRKPEDEDEAAETEETEPEIVITVYD
jgi:serine/threonine-protein kinase